MFNEILVNVVYSLLSLLVGILAYEVLKTVVAHYRTGTSKNRDVFSDARNYFKQANKAYRFGYVEPSQRKECDSLVLRSYRTSYKGSRSYRASYT